MKQILLIECFRNMRVIYCNSARDGGGAQDVGGAGVRFFPHRVPNGEDFPKLTSCMNRKRQMNNTTPNRRESHFIGNIPSFRACYLNSHKKYEKNWKHRLI